MHVIVAAAAGEWLGVIAVIFAMWGLAFFLRRNAELLNFDVKSLTPAGWSVTVVIVICSLAVGGITSQALPIRFISSGYAAERARILIAIFMGAASAVIVFAIAKVVLNKFAISLTQRGDADDRPDGGVQG